MAILRENDPNFKMDEFKHSVSTLKTTGFATYVGRSDSDRPLTIKCCHLRPPAAAGHVVHACEVIADAVGLNSKEQVHYEPRKKLTIYPALKNAIIDIFRK